MKVIYRVVVKRGYLKDFIFEENNLREAGYIADMFLDKLVEPEDVNISIEPYKLVEPMEEEIENE